MFIVFLNWTHRFSQLCSFLNVEWFIKFENVVHFLLNMCMYGVCSLILTKPHINQRCPIEMIIQIPCAYLIFVKLQAFLEL